MLWTLLLSPASAWTCAEATHIFANETQAARAATRLREGWQYTDEEKLCLKTGGVTANLVDGQLHAQEGAPFRRKLSADPEIHTVVLDLTCGTVRVRGGRAQELQVYGFDGSGGEGPTIEATEGTVTVRRPRDAAHCTDLSVTAPADARLLVYSRGQHVVIEGMKAAVEVSATSANVTVVGPTPLVEIDTIKGDVMIDVTGSVEVEAAEGIVAVAAGEGATVRITTVTGHQFVWGGPLRRLDASSVQGHIRSQATLQPAAVVDAQSNSGDVVIGVPAAMAKLLPKPLVAPELLRGGFEGSMRPDRILPDGNPSAAACFECLPVEVRGVWAPDAPVRFIPALGARLVVTAPESVQLARIRAESLSGNAASVEMPRAPAAATGHLVDAMLELGPTLGACRADLASAPPAAGVDLWAKLEVNEGRVASVAFDVEGFDPALIACLQKTMSKWTLPGEVNARVDWPLKLRVLRTPAP